jgi:chaperone BCS1
MCRGQDTSPLRQLIQDAIDYNVEKETGLVKIYQMHRWGDMWEECQ